MKKYVLLISIFLFSSAYGDRSIGQEPQDCDFYLKRHLSTKADAERFEKAAGAAAAIGSYFGNVVSLAGSAFFSYAAAEHRRRSNKALVKYEDCLVYTELERQRQLEEKNRKEKEEQEKKRKEDKKKDEEESKKEKEDFEEDHEIRIACVSGSYIAAKKPQEPYEVDIEFDKKAFAELELFEYWWKKMEEAKNNPVKAAVNIGVEAATAPLKVLGIKTGKIKL